MRTTTITVRDKVLWAVNVLMLGALLIGAALGVAQCSKQERQRFLNPISSQQWLQEHIYYVRDDRTNICFAMMVGGNSPGPVACTEEVMDLVTKFEEGR